MNNSVLSQPLNYKLNDNKYYLTLVGKNLKTKKGNNVFTKGIISAQNVIQDYEDFKFKSKWLNLVSNYTDFCLTDLDIKNSKEQLLNYFKTDHLIYVGDNKDYMAFYNKEISPLLSMFSNIVNFKQIVKPLTGFEKQDFSEEEALNNFIDNLSVNQLFVALFLTRISTSSILTILYLNKHITIDQFYKYAFYAELTMLQKAPDPEEQKRLDAIKNELDIINSFYLEI